MQKERRVKEIEVVENDTGKIVHSVDCKGQIERFAQRVEMGMLSYMDRERFHTRMVYVDESANQL